MQEPRFTTKTNNVFTELAELRLDLKARDDDFDVLCRLIFGKMEYEYNSRQYEIGLRRAHLRLSLEGCETTIEPAFGEKELPSVTETETQELNATVGASVAVNASFSSSVGAKMHFDVGASGNRQQCSNQTRTRLPMTRKPGDSWEVIPQAVSISEDAKLDGSAIAGQKLCTLQRTVGGNRLAAVGEVQVARAAIVVSAKHGNKVGRALDEWQNKDAIVSQILKRALQREARSGTESKFASVVVVSKAEVLEE